MVWTKYKPPIHVAASLNALAAQYDRIEPRRDRASDGALGNAAHAARASDHNPDYANGGIIRAVDLSTTSHGVAGQHFTPADRAWHHALIADLIATEIRNPVDRLWYLIHWIPGDPYPKIWSRTNGWAPQRYSGPSPHDHHWHTSIMRTRAAETDTKPWFTKLRGGTVAQVVSGASGIVRMVASGLGGLKRTGAPQRYHRGVFHTTQAATVHRWPDSQSKAVRQLPVGTDIQVGAWVGQADTHGWVQNAVHPNEYLNFDTLEAGRAVVPDPPTRAK